MAKNEVYVIMGNYDRAASWPLMVFTDESIAETMVEGMRAYKASRLPAMFNPMPSIKWSQYDTVEVVPVPVDPD